MKINLQSMSTEELKTLRSWIASELNYRSHQQLVENKSTISVGNHVTVNHVKTKGKIYQVTSMRRTKATIQNIENSRESYNLPISMMEKHRYIVA